LIAIAPYVDEIREKLGPHADRMLELLRPHIRISTRKAKAADLKLGGSRLGGLPDLPPGVDWPSANGEPIDFVGQIALADVARRDVDGKLPRDGVLAFFLGWAENERGWAAQVVYSDGELTPREWPGAGRLPRHRRPPKPTGIDFTADVVLPPPSSRFVSSDERRPSYDPRTGESRLQPAVVALPQPVFEAYYEIWERWHEAHDHAHHGMLGYDRYLEGYQLPAQVMLLRLDADGTIPFDFVEAACLYFLIDEDALAGEDFANVDAYLGATI
jgi:uncharacterized protein YwqG